MNTTANAVIPGIYTTMFVEQFFIIIYSMRVYGQNSISRFIF